jgi:hypothetical protein
MGNLDYHLLQTSPEQRPAADYLYITFFEVSGQILFQAFDIILLVGHDSQEVKPVVGEGRQKTSLYATVEQGSAEEDATGIEQGFQVLEDGTFGLHGDRQAVQQVVHSYGVEWRAINLKRFQGITSVALREVSCQSLPGDCQAVWLQVHQHEARVGYRERAFVQEIAGTDADIQVVCRYVLIVQPDDIV